MDLRQLLEALKDPSASVSVGEKLLAGISVAIISMIVVFIVLVLISGIISLLQRETKKTKNLNKEVERISGENSENNELDDIGELVAVITAAISAQIGKNADNIVVKKVIRSNNYKSSWENMKNSINR